MSLIAQPKQAGEVSIYPTIVIGDPVVYPKKPELPFSILSNCYAYAKYRYPSLPDSKTILSNLSDHGQIAVFYYPESGLYHYAVVEDYATLTVTHTNYGGPYKKTERMSPHRLIGFYSL